MMTDSTSAPGSLTEHGIVRPHFSTVANGGQKELVMTFGRYNGVVRFDSESVAQGIVDALHGSIAHGLFAAWNSNAPVKRVAETAGNRHMAQVALSLDNPDEIAQFIRAFCPKLVEDAGKWDNLRDSEALRGYERKFTDGILGTLRAEGASSIATEIQQQLNRTTTRSPG